MAWSAKHVPEPIRFMGSRPSASYDESDPRARVMDPRGLLLMIAGDIWQFNYPGPFDQPIPIFDPAAIERIAKQYKAEGQQLWHGRLADAENPRDTGETPVHSSVAAAPVQEVLVGPQKRITIVHRLPAGPRIRGRA